jgi:hypothetical protein
MHHIKYNRIHIFFQLNIIADDYNVLIQVETHIQLASFQQHS